ncbi:MAG: LacI family DNA-binding transcriptional regulator [Chloroflexota bacterium]
METGFGGTGVGFPTNINRESRMATTLRDIARELGISVTTVSRGLAGYSDVAEDTKARIQATADRLGYTPNLTARRLQKRRTDTLGFILPTLTPRFSDPFFSEFLAGVGNEAASRGYDLLVSVQAPGSTEERAAYERAAAGGWVDGLFVVRTRVNDERITRLCDGNFPFVAFGRTECDCEFPYVDEDSAAGVHQIITHLVDLGHSAIAFVAPPSYLMFGRYRIQGFYEAMAAHNLEVREKWIIEGDMTQRGGETAAQSLLALTERPTAIIFGNDLMAIGGMNGIKATGLQPGVDIAVGGFDNISLSSYVTPSLTTIEQPIYDIGQRLCTMLIDVINERELTERHVLLSPTLIVRDSSGPRIQAGSRR